MNHYKHGSRPTIGILTGWQIYGGNVEGYLDQVLRGSQSIAREQGFNLLFASGVTHPMASINENPAWPNGSPSSDFVPVGPWNTDGLIVIRPLLSTERARYIQKIQKEGYPVVFIGPGEGRSVVLDNESGIRQAMAHLVQHGYRQIAFVSGREGDQDSLQRLAAYQAAVRDYGLDDDPDLIVCGSHNINGGRQAMRQLLESGKPIQAILASNDVSAFGAMSVLHESNLRIPEDIAVIGFDDRPDSAFQKPRLTTVRYPIIEAARKALTMLIDTINGQFEGENVVSIPVHLIVRESCGCLPGRPIAVMASPQENARAAAKRQLILRMVKAVQSEARFLETKDIEALCAELAQVFIRSLKENRPVIFRTAFQGILQRVGAAEDDPTVLHPALLELEQGGLELWGPSAGELAVTMLNQARADIILSTREWHGQYAINKGYLADQLGLSTSSLSAATDNSQIFEVLREFLPLIGIGRADIGFYERDEDDPVMWSQLYRVADSNPVPIRFPSRQFPPDGFYSSEKPFHLALFPLVHRDHVDGFIVFDTFDLGTCVTLARQITAALHGVRLYHEAAEGRLQAEEANRMKSRFLASVSHELRTPLNLIVGLSEILLDGRNEQPSLDAYRRDVAQIHTSAQHLGWLIRDVLDLASSQAGQLRLINGPVDTTQVLAVVAAAGEQLAREKGLAWEAEIPADLPVLWGDQTRLTQVGLNLVSNAVKFTEEGQVSLRAWVDEKSLVVEVSDTGLGIPSQEQQAIFNEFRQSERSSKRGYGGLGLGLAICKRLVELHQGEIGVRSSGEDRSGSTFYFKLPIPDARRLDMSKLPTALVAVEVAEDGERVRAHLEREGFEVEICLAGEDGEWLAEALSREPQAVVLDATLAARQGWEVLKALKSNPPTQAIPVLFYALQDETGSMLSLDYLSKPLSPQALTAALDLKGLAATEEATKTVLVVDDEPATLEMHTRVVAGLGAGYRVLKARNGREALQVIREALPDLVLLDLMMPELDGFGVLEAMRAGETTRDIPVIVLTAQVLNESDMARLNRGVANVLQKGIFSVQETLDHIETALSRLPRLNSEMQKVIRRTMAYIQEHYAESYSRKEIALHVGVSESYLTRCFRQELGITPAEYLNRYRMKKAKAMLEAGKSITATALEVGFLSVSSFNKFFRKETGMSPNAYRYERPGE